MSKCRLLDEAMAAPYVGGLEVLALTGVLAPRHHFQFLDAARQAFRPWRGLGELRLPDPESRHPTSAEAFARWRNRYYEHVDPKTRVRFASELRSGSEATPAAT